MDSKTIERIVRTASEKATISKSVCYRLVKDAHKIVTWYREHGKPNNWYEAELEALKDKYKEIGGKRNIDRFV